jgi:hypothetical protein
MKRISESKPLPRKKDWARLVGFESAVHHPLFSHQQMGTQIYVDLVGPSFMRFKGTALRPAEAAGSNQIRACRPGVDGRPAAVSCSIVQDFDGDN